MQHSYSLTRLQPQGSCDCPVRQYVWNIGVSLTVSRPLYWHVYVCLKEMLLLSGDIHKICHKPMSLLTLLWSVLLHKEKRLGAKYNGKSSSCAYRLYKILSWPPFFFCFSISCLVSRLLWSVFIVHKTTSIPISMLGSHLIHGAITRRRYVSK